MSPTVRAGGALLLLLVGAASACRFERRPDLVADEPVPPTTYAPADHATTPVEDSVRAAVTALADALGAGDTVRVAELTTGDVVLIDPDDDARWTRAGGRLPGSLTAARDGGPAWAVEGVAFSVLADGTALYSCLLTTPTANPPSSAVESWIVVRTADGWRVRYLHRSQGRSTLQP